MQRIEDYSMTTSPWKTGAERWASGEAGSRRLHAFVRGFGGCAASHVEGTGPARALRALLVGSPWVVVTVPALVLGARW